MRRRIRWAAVGLALGAVMLTASVSAVTISPKSEGLIHAGGVLTDMVTIGGVWPTLDPAYNTDTAADAAYMDDVYGQLFELGPNDAIIPDIASGYSWTGHNLTLEITIRPGVKFSDGNPLTAANVAWSMNRDLQPSTGCVCISTFSAVSGPVTTHGKYEVIIHLSHVDSAIVAAFNPNAPNWVVDEAALNSMGEAAYAQHPIGAGPFKIQTNVPDSTLDLVKNPHYWQPGRPYLAGLDYIAVGSDQAAYNALQTGQAQAITLSTVSLIRQVQAAKTYEVHKGSALNYFFVSFNEASAPFNNVLAREAITYATNPKAIVDNVDGGLYSLTEGPTASGELLYYGNKVPGYDSYNLSKATALVSQLGGLSVKLLTGFTDPGTVTIASALSQEWAAAGIKTNIDLENLTQATADLYSHNWQAFYIAYGTVDPSVALNAFFVSHGVYSGTLDPTVDGLANQGTLYVNPATRERVYLKLAEAMAKNADIDFLWQANIYSVTTKAAGGWFKANFAKAGQTLWEDVYLK